MECLSMKGREIFKLMKSPLKSGFYCKIHTCVKREHIFLSDSIFSIVIFFSICLSAIYFLNILSELWEIITFVVCTLHTARIMGILVMILSRAVFVPLVTRRVCLE